MLEGDGPPPADLFVEDELHLNEKGYALWDAVLEPHLSALCREPQGE
jgi:hypothetical protein